MVPKQSQMVPKQSQNSPKWSQNSPKMVPKQSHYLPFQSSFLAKNKLYPPALTSIEFLLKTPLRKIALVPLFVNQFPNQLFLFCKQNYVFLYFIFINLFVIILLLKTHFVCYSMNPRLNSLVCASLDLALNKCSVSTVILLVQFSLLYPRAKTFGMLFLQLYTYILYQF